MAEWSKAHAWKACRRVTVSRVRIPSSPPLTKNELTYPRDGITSKDQNLRAFSLFVIDFLSIENTPFFSNFSPIYATFLKNTVFRFNLFRLCNKLWYKRCSQFLRCTDWCNFGYVYYLT